MIVTKIISECDNCGEVTEHSRFRKWGLLFLCYGCYKDIRDNAVKGPVE